MRCVTSKPDDAEQALETVVRPLSRPNKCISSWAAIDQRGPLSLPGRSSGPMPDQRWFAEAGLVVGERDDDHLRLSEVFHRPESRSTSKRLNSSRLAGYLTSADPAAVVLRKERLSKTIAGRGVRCASAIREGGVG